MKKTGFWKKLTMGALAISFGASLLACGSGAQTEAGADSAYLAVDINPSVEFIIKDGKVSGVTAVNDDAYVLISGVTFEGLTAEDAVKKIVDLAEELGYLTQANRDVKITVASDDDGYAKKVEDWAKRGAELASTLARVNTDPRFADEWTCKKLKEEGLPNVFDKMDAKKVRLIEAIMRYDDTMTYEKGVAMSFEELAELLDDYMETYKELVTEELRNDFKEKMEEWYAQVETQIATLYERFAPPAYAELWEQAQALEKAYKTLEQTVEMQLAETSVLENADVASLLSSLHIDVETAFAEFEIVNADTLQRYVEKYLEKAFRRGELKDVLLEGETDVKTYVHDVLDNLEGLLDAYDEDNYVLTQADVDAIKAVVGETVALTAGMTLDELEEIVENVEDALENAWDELDGVTKKVIEEGIEAIKATMETLHSHKQDVMNALRDKIEAGKDFWKDMKDNRRPNPENGGDAGSDEAA